MEIGLGFTSQALRAAHWGVHARSLDDGTSRAGWPVDVSTIHAVNGGQAFDPPLQNQRSSIIAVGGDLYVVYGGHFGDCGNCGTCGDFVCRANC